MYMHKLEAHTSSVAACAHTHNRNMPETNIPYSGLWGFLEVRIFWGRLSSKIFSCFFVAGEATSHCWLCVFVWAPLSWIPASLWLKVEDKPPSSFVLAQLQVRCLMKKQQQIPAFISSWLRDISCIIFDMSRVDHQSTLLSFSFSPYNNKACSLL